jgi:riboflavin kinase/FMN adenylyltransferase
MEIIRNGETAASRRLDNTAVTIGVFDGVHRGHTAVLQRLGEITAAGSHSTSLLVTFDRHPLSITHPEMVPPLLTTLEEKLHVLEEMGIETVVVERFTQETAGTDYAAYIAGRLVGGLGMRHLVIGYDFHLGRARAGSQERLLAEGRRLGFGVTVVPPVVLQGSVVSSTKIRRDIMERRFEHAARCLGRPFFLEATVEAGEGVGRRIGFPTANLSIDDPQKLMPPRGVYAVQVDAPAGRFGGMLNIGSAPTVRTAADRRIEVHLFSFHGELYGTRVRAHFISFMRDERRFENEEALRAQLMHDERAASIILEKKH